MAKNDGTHPNAPAFYAGASAFRSAAPLGENPDMDKWMRPGLLNGHKKSTKPKDTCRVSVDNIPRLISSDPDFLKSTYAINLKNGRDEQTQGDFKRDGLLKAEESNLRFKNTDNRFYLQIELAKAGNRFISTWKVEGIYDFEPFSKGYFTNIPLGHGYVLKLPDGLSHYLTQIGVAHDFKYSATWNESWE